MSLAYSILAHREPKQVEHLVRSLMNGDDLFVLHFDARAPQNLHDLGRRLKREFPNVIVQRPHKILWGGSLMAEVQVQAMKLALAASTKWKHFLTLTGQDFPLKAREEMLGVLDPELSYLSSFDPMEENLWSDAKQRLTRYYLHSTRLHRLLTLPGAGRRIKAVLGWSNQLPHVWKLNRPMPRFFRYFGGSNHINLSRTAAKYVAESEPARKVLRWLRHAANSDEIAFQSILLNSKHADTIVNDTLREIDFPENSAHPRVFTQDDLPRLLTSEKIFARKFDMNVDADVLATLEQQVKA